MCRLFATYGKTDGWPDAVMEFQKLAQWGAIPPVQGATAGHKDGWGMATSDADGPPMVPVGRYMDSAYRSHRFQELLLALKEQPRIFLCHLRKASQSIPVNLANVHPFFLNGWAFIHNGTVYRAETLERNPAFEPTADHSDSEYLFHHLITRMGDRLSGSEALQALADAVNALPVAYTSVSCLLSNGRELFVVRKFMRYPDYYTLYLHRQPTGIILSSEPLAGGPLEADGWQLLPADSFLRISGDPPVVESL
jgi:predicted glutamine amidotransferase